MLADLIRTGYGEEQDFNCAEKILNGANIAYDLGLDQEALKLAAGFGGGMAIEDVCGAVAASIMVLGKLFVKERAHESTRIKDLSTEFLQVYREAMGEIDCAPLKAKYRTEALKCRQIIVKAAEILDVIVTRERNR